MNHYFFLWYYTKGLQAAFFLYGNLLRFMEHRFHTRRLLLTLFSPWKRDISFKDWRGFSPLKSLTRLFQNLIARFMGMIVRSVVIVFGIFAILTSFVFGGGFILLYIAAPFSLVSGILLFMATPLLGALLFMSGVIGGVMGFVGYLLRYQAESETYDIVLLRKRRWFPRLLARLGVDKQNLNSDDLESTENFLRFLGTLGIDEKLYQETVKMESEMAKRRDIKHRFWIWENLRKSIPVGRGWNYAYTPHLDRFCIDLSQRDSTEYAHLDLVGRKEEFKIASVVLGRPVENSILLVGEPGIGKKTFVHYLSRLIRENAFLHTPLAEARVMLFDFGQAVSAARSEGSDPDAFMRRLLNEVTYAGNVILFVENIDVFLNADASGKNFAPLICDYLAYPTFRLIGTVTTSHYHSMTKTEDQMLKFLETIFLRETTEEETLSVLAHQFERAEYKQIVFTIKSFMSIVRSAEKLKWDVPFPERAIDLAQEVLSYWQGTNEPRITAETVNAFVTLKTGVPSGSISQDEKDKLLKLEELLHARVIGQDEAVKQVAEAMRKARAGFGNDKRPLGSFIFLGPTGVGKTETVKAFAESYFGSEDRMIRLDMSEYQTPDAVTRLLGSEETNTPGRLINAVNEAPFSILLLDELEKAYPKVLDIFLQILDEGYVTDGFGKKTNFRNMIIIATSNAGSPIIRQLVENGADIKEIRDQVLDFVVNENVFRLEFLNRFDGMIFFEPLKNEEVVEVTNLKLDSFAKRLKKEKNITIVFGNGVAEKIVEKGYEPEFGARSINRYIEDAIEDVVVKQIIGGQVSDGGTLTVSAEHL